MHTRSELSLKDEETKFGTELDGLKVEKGEKRLLKNDEHTFRLGKTEHIFRFVLSPSRGRQADDKLFRVKWRPVVLTFSFSSKETKGGKDPLAEIRGKLEHLDIKTIIPYIPGTTTHVVQSKRNTAKGLQALINARYIVTNTYIDALVEATTSGDPLEEESFSLLEEDYDKNWPDPLRYLPAKSKEPKERPAELFAPHHQRSNIFEGYMFVFCDQVQFDTLLQPITNAGGKAFIFRLKLGETRSDEIVRFVKELAGEKSMGELEDESEGKGIVVVRFRGGSREYEDWAINLGDQVAVALGQRMIEQSEFMDSILIKDPTTLRKPLQVDDEPASTASLANNAASQPERSEIARPEISQPSRHTRGPIRSRFKGFDDEFDISAIPAAPRDASNGSLESNLNSSRSQRRTQPALFADSQLDADPTDSYYQATQTPNPRKRPAPPPELEDEEDIMDGLLPAAAAMKRRKIQQQDEAERAGKSFDDASAKPTSKEPEPARKPKKKINIKDAVRERREAEEQATRQDEEFMQETIGEMNVEEMKRLAVVEDMAIPARSYRPMRHVANGPTSDRWNDHWNGRKNFKKFRRQGEGAQARRGLTVMVPLEQVKQKDFGIGEEYWLDNSDKAKRRRKDKTQSQSQAFSSAKSPQIEEEDAELEEPSELEVPAELAIDAADDTPDTINVEVPRTTRRMEHTQDTGQSSIRSAAATGTKRAAPAKAKPPPAKKQKIVTVRDSDDSDSEDELKFRFRRKK